MEWAKVKELIAKLKKQATANGHDPNSLEISLFEESVPDQKTMEEMETAGVKRFILPFSDKAVNKHYPPLIY